MEVDIDVSKGKGVDEVGGSGCKGKELAEEETDKRIAPMESQELVRVAASAKVCTEHGGSATVDLQAIVPHSKSSTTASVRLTSGKATVSVSAEEPTKTSQRRKLEELSFFFHGKPRSSECAYFCVSCYAATCSLM
uniref:Uncharacterized protein n=1 Tax=Oryza punctata TaxID=4537 RepID=A0A0E0LYZ6_ORYPU